MSKSSKPRRSTRQIRASLHATRERLDEDLTELQIQAESSLSPRALIARHPALMTAAGAIIGLLVVRNPAMVGRALKRLAQASAPFLMRAVFQRGGSAIADMAAGSNEQT